MTDRMEIVSSVQRKIKAMATQTGQQYMELTYEEAAVARQLLKPIADRGGETAASAQVILNAINKVTN